MGIAVQLPSFITGSRLQRYSGATSGELIFQLLTSSAEELLFRGVLLPYLAAAIPLGTTRRSWLASGLLLSIPFALLHGLHPVLFRGGRFDIGWAESTFTFSLIAGVLYAYVPFVVAPAATHTVSNFAYELF